MWYILWRAIKAEKTPVLDVITGFFFDVGF